MALLLLPLASFAGEPTYVVTGETAPAYEIAAGKGEARLLHGPSTGSAAAALELLRLAPGAAVPPHVHDGSTELLYIITGEVEMTVAGRVYRAGEDDAVHIPAGVEHSAKVVGSALEAVQVYVGPGPEQRFTTGKKLQ